MVMNIWHYYWTIGLWLDTVYRICWLELQMVTMYVAHSIDCIQCMCTMLF